MQGRWQGIGAAKKQSFEWTFEPDGLAAVHLVAKISDSKSFTFRLEKGEINCYPACYRCKCGTPDACYRLIEQIGSGYIFEARNPAIKNRHTLSFLFSGENRMTLVWDFDYEDWPDRRTVVSFERR